MKIVVFASSKGGVGKTTLAFNCAIEAARHGTVFLADMDPQKSLEGLCNRRAKDQRDLLDGDRMTLLEGVETIEQTVADLARAGYERDFLIVDLPGSFMRIIKEAISMADCIVLPLQPSPMDVLAQEDVAKIVDELGAVHKTLFVLNRIDNRSSISDETIQKITPILPNPPIKVVQRVDYARAMIGGKAGNETNAEARTEIETLWSAITKITGKEDNEKAQHDGRRTRRPEGSSNRVGR